IVVLLSILCQDVYMVNDPVQAAKALEVKGVWKRWTEYRIVNSTVQRAENADLEEYDPWDSYRLNTGTYRTVNQPYTSFLNLGRQLKALEAQGIMTSLPAHTSANLPEGPTNEADSLVLKWC